MNTPATPSTDAPSEWRGILRHDERILWQGGPVNDDPYEKSSALRVLTGLAGMAIVPVIIVRNAGEPGQPSALIWLFGVFIIALIAWQAFGRSAFASYKIRNSFYTLTTRRAFVGWRLFGRRKLDTYDIISHTKIEYQPGRPGKPGSVYFAEKIHKTEDSSWVEKIGFLNTYDAQSIYELMLKVQKGDV